MRDMFVPDNPRGFLVVGAASYRQVGFNKVLETNEQFANFKTTKKL